MMDRKKVLDRFFKYISFDTQSDSGSKTFPSTLKQLELAKYLQNEMLSLGLKDVKLSEYGVLTGYLDSNINYKVPNIGFIAHMDTSPDISGADVKAKIVEYTGEDIPLSSDGSILLSANEFNELNNYVGEEIIVTDGTTLLGADDKAGVAAIMSAMEYLAANPHIPHGRICVGFTPDEEVGRGVVNFDVPSFGADFAYTVDGGAIGSIEYENFNAANATVTVKGRNVHPGASKNKMINSISIACEFQSLLPKGEKPELTENYEGFFHVNGISGNVESTEFRVLIRDHDSDKFKEKQDMITLISDFLNNKYGAGTVNISIKPMYLNMREKIEPVMYVVDLAKEAMAKAGVNPVTTPVRGGTDGARLSFMGLPCPNLFTGGHNFHGRFEFLPVNSLLKSAEVVVNIAELGSKLK